MIKDNKIAEASRIAMEPVNGKLAPERRLESSLRLSELVMKMTTHVICHVIVDYDDLLGEERFSVANAFLQRVTSTHLCNHKLTKEGIVLKYKGETFRLHEEFKTMTLTRSVYEHLVMFYFLYAHPKSEEERNVVWNYWKINSKKNLLDFGAIERPRGVRVDKDADAVRNEIETLRREMFSTRIGMECYQKLNEWTALGKTTQNSCIAFYWSHGADGQGGHGRYDVRRVSYNQAWRYIFNKGHESVANARGDQLYRHLSIHSHPIYDGLQQYQDQGLKDEGNDGVPLYLSSCFLAYLCHLFLRLIPDGGKMFDDDFSEEERLAFKALCTSLENSD